MDWRFRGDTRALYTRTHPRMSLQRTLSSIQSVGETDPESVPALDLRGSTTTVSYRASPSLGCSRLASLPILSSG